MVTTLALAPFSARVTPRCPYFGECGGCTLQDLAYEDQLALKRQQLKQLFAGVAGLDVSSLEVIGCQPPWRYRNKAELSFGVSDGRLALGFHAAGSFHRVVDWEDCLLLPENLVLPLRRLRQLAEAARLSVYHSRTHQGFLRYAVVRASHATHQVLLCLVTAAGSSEEMECLRQIARCLSEEYPQLAGIYWGQTDRLANVAVPEKLEHWQGAEWLDDVLGPFRLQLHPLAFLQSNSIQADRLYSAVCEALALSEDTIAWDVYCGIGLIGFYLSRRLRKVYGIDSEPHHLEQARHNAGLNRIENIEWICAKAEEALKDRRFWPTRAKPDLVVVDPPRTGLSRQVLSAILAARPRQIAYISCNPQALVRDLGVLLNSFPRYAPVKAGAFDMFPQTRHVETFVVLQR